MRPEYVSAKTFHLRHGEKQNRFTYNVDYVLLDIEQGQDKPAFFSINRFNLFSIFSRDHGGKRESGRGAAWVRTVLAEQGLAIDQSWRILLLAQPRVIGTKFSPVSFWLVVDRDERLRLSLVEVNNTFGERHYYLCAKQDLAPIHENDSLDASKVFHVSPFQPVSGAYRFNFDLTPTKISIRIDYRHADGGVLATLSGARKLLSNNVIIAVLFARFFGSIRTLALIHFQAAILWFKGAKYRQKPAAPEKLVSQG